MHDRFRSTELHDLPSKELWQGHLAANMLAQIFEIDTAACALLSQRLLGSKPGSVCWSILEDALCKRGLFPEAIELRKQQDAIYHLTRIAELQAQKVSPETAEITYWEIMNLLKSWRRQSYCIFWIASSAETLLKLGFNPLAKRIFTHLTKIAGEIQDFDDRIESLLYIIDHQIEASGIDLLLLQDASTTLHVINISEIFDLYIKAKVLEKTAKLSAKSGDSTQARAFFNEALEIAQTIADPEKKQTVLRNIAYAQASARFTADALETIKRMADDSHQSSTVSHVLRQQLSEQDFEAAFQTIAQAYQYWDKASGLQSIAQAQAEAQQFSEAIETTELISENFHKSSAWSSIVKAQAQNLFESEDGSMALNEIFETIEQKISSHHEQVQALREIAAMQLKRK